MHVSSIFERVALFDSKGELFAELVEGGVVGQVQPVEAGVGAGERGGANSGHVTAI